MSSICPYKSIPKNFYNKTIISQICLENKFYEDKESCDYGKWDSCTFHLNAPSKITKENLNHLNVTCKNSKENKKKSNCKIEENCFCIATGEYDGYFNENLPILKCICYNKKSEYIPAISNKEKQNIILNGEDKHKCECKDSTKIIRRVCEICTTYPGKQSGICQILKGKHHFEHTIDCTDPEIEKQVGKLIRSTEDSKGYITAGLRWFGLDHDMIHNPFGSLNFPFKGIESKQKFLNIKGDTIFNHTNAFFALVLCLSIGLFLYMESMFLRKNDSLKLNSKRRTLRNRKDNVKENKELDSTEESTEESKENSTEETKKDSDENIGEKEEK